jgi:predicted ester cyclase
MTTKELFLEAMRRNDEGDLDAFVAFQAPDAIWHTPSGDVHGHDELRAWLQPWIRGFPNQRHHQIDRVVELDGTVYCQGVFHGVNEGAMETPEGTLPPTGKPVAIPFALIVDMDAEARHATDVSLYMDQLGFLGQLGLMPAAA